MFCSKCGGKMIGDGVTEVYRCENSSPPLHLEVDVGPVECGQYDFEIEDISFRYGTLEVEMKNPEAYCVAYCAGLDEKETRQLYETMKRWYES